MTLPRRPATLLSLPPIVAALTGCPDPSASRCSLAEFKLDEAVAVTRLPAAQLVRAGTRFALVGLEDGNVRWSSLSPTGQLSGGGTFTLPAERLQGVELATVGAMGSPGNDLLALYRVPGPAGSDTTLVQVIAQPSGGAPGSPATLFTTPPGANPDDLVIRASSGRTGTVALVAIGYRNQPGAPVNLFVLGPGGTRIDNFPRQVDELPDNWTCLDLKPGKPGSEFTLSYVNLREAVTTDSELVIYLYSELGARTRSYYGISHQKLDANCPIVAPTQAGHVYAWQTNADGTYVGQTEGGGGMILRPFSEVYWGPRQPRLVGAIGIGNSVALAYAPVTSNKEAPLVKLINFQGYEIGSQLTLPASGQNAVLEPSVVADPEGFHFTYRERRSETENTGPRRLVRVTCPEK